MANDDFEDILKRLRDGDMLSPPGVAAHVRRAIETGDHQPLLDFLDNYPVILATADRNIALNKHQEADNPFRPYPSRADAADYLSGRLALGYVNEFDDQFGLSPDTFVVPSITYGRPGGGKSYKGRSKCEAGGGLKA